MQQIAHVIALNMMSRVSSYRGESSDMSRRREGTIRCTDISILPFAPHSITKENLPRLDRGFLVRPWGWDAPNDLLATEWMQLERAILAGQDGILGMCGFNFPSFPLGFLMQMQFSYVHQLGLFSSEPTCPIRGASVIPAVWELHRQHKLRPSFAGHTLLLSGSQFAIEGYDRLCFLDQIMSGSTASWYDRWSVVSSHRFHFGMTEWLIGVLHYYHDMLDQVGLRHAVTAALYDYPCHSGLLQLLAERFKRRFNTFGTAEGETSLDLWTFHRISGLPVSGHFYGVCLDDLHHDYSTGAGSYVLPYSFRQPMKVWRGLARCGKEKSPPASSGNVRVSFTAWVRYFYHGPYCFCDGFASDTHDPGSCM
ncbi:hypothetical protein Taro_018237 [Colocasia esculenta]|uniref:Uncharacterized protein n=1 Tax=Colocasia esculenta TaxID=4460 RepID=A0A843UYI1_COLES|nr:hypothetical protein [Colocasia esculenta]